MTKFLFVACFLLGTAALAGGVLHLVAKDEAGEVVFAPRIDTQALGWWMDRAETIAERASTLDEAAVSGVKRISRQRLDCGARPVPTNSVGRVVI